MITNKETKKRQENGFTSNALALSRSFDFGSQPQYQPPGPVGAQPLQQNPYNGMYLEVHPLNLPNSPIYQQHMAYPQYPQPPLPGGTNAPIGMSKIVTTDAISANNNESNSVGPLNDADLVNTPICWTINDNTSINNQYIVSTNINSQNRLLLGDRACNNNRNTQPLYGQGHGNTCSPLGEPPLIQSNMPPSNDGMVANRVVYYTPKKDSSSVQAFHHTVNDNRHLQSIHPPFSSHEPPTNLEKPHINIGTNFISSTPQNLGRCSITEASSPIVQTFQPPTTDDMDILRTEKAPTHLISSPNRARKKCFENQDANSVDVEPICAKPLDHGSTSAAQINANHSATKISNIINHDNNGTDNSAASVAAKVEPKPSEPLLPKTTRVSDVIKLLNQDEHIHSLPPQQNISINENVGPYINELKPTTTGTSADDNNNGDDAIPPLRIKIKPLVKKESRNGNSEKKQKSTHVKVLNSKINRKPKSLHVRISTNLDSLNNRGRKRNSGNKIPNKFITLKISSDKYKLLLSSEAIPSSALDQLEENEHEPKNKQIEQKVEKPININEIDLPLTTAQVEGINENNKMVTASGVITQEDINAELPNLINISQLTVPNIPEGYVPLVMAPNGMLIPMELIRMNVSDNVVSVMRPSWKTLDTVAKLEATEKYKAEEQIEKLTTTHPNVQEDFTFNDRDKLASLQLYLLSKESKCLNTETLYVSGKKKYQKEIDYYNRLLEREKLERLDIYKRELNKYQTLLNKLEQGDEMFDFETDLIEYRDYELLREDLFSKYNEEHIYMDYLDSVLELESMQCLDYASRLVKLKNYLNMENERLKRHQKKLCRINSTKSQSIWNRYVKSGSHKTFLKSTNSSSNSNINNHDSDSSSAGGSSSKNFDFIFNLISRDDFILLTNPNSRLYGSYVLNNSVDKGNENQEEIVELLEYYLPEKCTLRELFREIKRIDYNVSDALKSKLSDNKNKKDMISAYGLKASTANSGNRLLKELQIDGMSVDIQKNDRLERRSVGQRKARTTANEMSYGHGYGDGTNEHGGEVASSNGIRKGINYRGNATRSKAQTNAHEHKNPNGGYGHSFHYNQQWATGDGSEANNDAEVGEIPGKEGNGPLNRKELNITSCLDSTLCAIDRVKMMNLNSEEIRANYTKVYGMPKGLHQEEVDEDLMYLRSFKKRRVE